MKQIHEVPSMRCRGTVRRLSAVLGVLVFGGATALPAFALEGQIQIHDPSTIVECNGKYYTYGTSGTALVSDDGWVWRRGTTPSRRGMAPDIIKLGDRYFQFVSANVGGQPRAEINLITNKTLDPDSPDFQWVEEGLIASSDGEEFCNAIDPGLFLDPTDGRLWLVYGSYFGFIRLVELDPKTGQRVDPEGKPYEIAINCEASIMIYKDGWYYLLATHGSCCQGANSGYNIRVGRSKKVTGPFLDHTGLDMLKGGGKLFLGSGGRIIGPGHFGLIDLGDGVQKFSLHYEADLDRGGASVMDILPLQWKDGWPVAGENVKAGTYRIESVRTGTAVELAVEGSAVGGGRRGGGGGMFGGGGGGGAIPDQQASDVSANWPEGNVGVGMANYMCQAQQKWTLTPVADVGGYFGSPFFKITVAGTERTLAVGSDAELVVLPAFTGGPEQLWQIDQLDDGSWRIMPKAIPGSDQRMALSAIGGSFATLSKYDPNSDKHRWLLKTP